MGRMDELMQMVAICELYHWTYQDYTSQPTYFIQLIKEKMVRDNKARQQASKQHRVG